MKLTFNIPLAITRQWLYMLTLLISIFGILLPISIVAYLNFYKVLIPKPITRIPLRFDPFSSNEVGMKSSLHLNNMYELLKEDPTIKYEIGLNLNVVCNRKNYDDIYNINSAFSIEDKIVSNNSFLLNCDTRFIYNENNRFIPYRLRFWVPPILTNIDKLINIKSPLSVVTGKQLLELMSEDERTSNALLRLDKRLVIDNNNSFLEMKIQWDGMRYYMLNYYFTSLFIGVLIFWIPSSFICLISSMIVLLKSTGGKKND